MSLHVCHSCFRKQVNPHRCAQCKFAHYCDRTCQRAAWEEHKHECAAIKQHGKAPTENVRWVEDLHWDPSETNMPSIWDQTSSHDIRFIGIGIKLPRVIGRSRFREKNWQMCIWAHIRHLFSFYNCTQSGLQCSVKIFHVSYAANNNSEYHLRNPFRLAYANYLANFGS